MFLTSATPPMLAACEHASVTVLLLWFLPTLTGPVGREPLCKKHPNTLRLAVRLTELSWVVA